MAKDPACLFYWGDWSGGTITFTRHLKGCYMDLLNAQFNNGPLSLDEIKTVLGTDFGSSWPTLQKKFVMGENGLFFNERMALETGKRKKFSEKQKINSDKRWHIPNRSQTDPKRMPLENENGNRIEDENEIDGVQGDLESDLKLAFDERYMAELAMSKAYPGIDLAAALVQFLVKVRGSPGDYASHLVAGLRKAFNHQLRHSKPPKNGTHQKPNITGTEVIEPGKDYGDLRKGFRRD